MSVGCQQHACSTLPTTAVERAKYLANFYLAVGRGGYKPPQVTNAINVTVANDHTILVFAPCELLIAVPTSVRTD
jgi:hypothetical protein